MNFKELEEQNGIRFSWNGILSTKLESESLSIPFGCMYTPLKILKEQKPLEYKPLECYNCLSFINPYCKINFNEKNWLCPFCNYKNSFPNSYHGMTPDCLAEELLPNRTTIEYISMDSNINNPIILLIVDICISEKEIFFLKNLLLQIISILPQNCLIGLITFGNLIYIHELKFSEVPRCYVFNGQKNYNSLELKTLLNLTPDIDLNNNSFFLPLNEAEQMLTSIIEQLEIDPFPIIKGQRQLRCTGVVTSIAISLIESIFTNIGAQVFLFTSGPITKGPGLMSSIKKNESLRQHGDIKKGKAQYLKDSYLYFQNLAEKANKSSISFNYLSASFEESGFYEIEPLISLTGGFSILCESWSEENLKDSLINYFEKNIFLYSGNESIINIKSINGIKFNGSIGAGLALPQTCDNSSNKIIGIGKTNQWKPCFLRPNSTISFYFEINNNINSFLIYFQFFSKYRSNLNGKLIYRITTISLPLIEKFNIINYLDQECAISLISRYSLIKFREINESVAFEYIDTTLINFLKNFNLLNNINFLLPNFIFNFRRSNFLNTFNSSLDQTAYLHLNLLTENISSIILMILPSLIKYNINGEIFSVPLNLNSLSEQSVLLLDSYFRILIWNGSTISIWRDQNYQELEEYSYLKNLLNKPLINAKELIENRFPVPPLINCDQDSSLSRYLLIKCNPPVIGNDFIIKYKNSLDKKEQTFESFLQKLNQLI